MKTSIRDLLEARKRRETLEGRTSTTGYEKEKKPKWNLPQDTLARVLGIIESAETGEIKNGDAVTNIRELLNDTKRI